MEHITCVETSVATYHPTTRNIPEKWKASITLRREACNLTPFIFDLGGGRTLKRTVIFINLGMKINSRYKFSNYDTDVGTPCHRTVLNNAS